MASVAPPAHPVVCEQRPVQRSRARKEAAVGVRNALCSLTVAVLKGVAAACLLTGAAPALQQPSASDGDRPSRTLEVTVTLLDGVDFTGKVVDDDEHGLVLFDGNAPYVFAWAELQAGAEYRVKLALLELKRGQAGPRAEDHFTLGQAMLSRHEVQLAVNEFRKAQKLDRTYEARTRAVMDEYRRRPAAHDATALPVEKEAPEFDAVPAGQTTGELLAALPAAASDDLRIIPTPADLAPQITAELKAFFGPRLAESINPDIALVETEHFLIWTDLPAALRPPLADAAEGMYAALCRQFGYDAKTCVFLAKCPIFCFRSRGEFYKFARTFDDYRGSSALGYTRSVEERGYVHVVLFLQGRAAEQWNRFLCTLVHEGSHAFLHRFRTSRLVPVWINEGYADLIAERVLSERCFTGENAALLARQFVRHDWPVRNLLRSTGPIQVHQYPIAQSIVGFLESRDKARFTAFLTALKDGAGVEEALMGSFDGLTLDGLEAQWRDSLRASLTGGG